MQMLNMWRDLGMRRQAAVIAATLAAFVAVLALSGAFTPTRMGLLYSGLDSAQSGEVLAALNQRNIEYQVRDGAIMVPEAKRDELRMSLAAEGLPTASAAGYELLDNISGFGTTSQMFDAAYWRAKEGELARTIAATPGVRAARVHLAVPAGRAFRGTTRPTASVMVTAAGRKMAPDQAKAVKYLVASAVAGMTPEDVTVVDGSGTLIGTEEEAASGATRAEELRTGVERILAARVGPGNAVVEVSLDLVTEKESLTERKLDPKGRIAISSETEEKSDTSNSQGSGDVTVASNLPDGAGKSGDQSSSAVSETRERVNYEVSETTRQLERAAGGTRRLTVAVLVNGVKPANGGTDWTPRSADELADLRELVASAVGFDEARGDVITIRSLPFEQIETAGTEAVNEGGGLGLDINRAIQVAAFSLVALILGLFVIRPILSGGARGRRAELDDSTPPAEGAGVAQSGTLLPPLAMPAPGDFAAEGSLGGSLAGALPGGGFEALGASPDADPVARLKRLIGERREETVEVLRSWMDEREGTP